MIQQQVGVLLCQDYRQPFSENKEQQIIPYHHRHNGSSGSKFFIDSTKLWDVISPTFNPSQHRDKFSFYLGQ